MKRQLTRHMQNSTGHALVFGLQPEFTVAKTCVEFEEHLGSLDAPESMSAGACEEFGDKVMLATVYRED